MTNLGRTTQRRQLDGDGGGSATAADDGKAALDAGDLENVHVVVEETREENGLR